MRKTISKHTKILIKVLLALFYLSSMLACTSKENPPEGTVAEGSGSSSSISSSSSSSVGIIEDPPLQNPSSSPAVITPLEDGSDIADISVWPITNDGVINSLEAVQLIPVQGQVFGGANQFDLVKLYVGEKVYEGQVDENREFSVAVPGEELVENKRIIASLEWDDSAQNFHMISTTSDHIVDVVSQAAIHVNQITSRDIVNALEASGQVMLSGSVSGDAKEGDLVSVQVNDTLYEGWVNRWGNFSVEVSGDVLQASRSLSVGVTGFDVHGNPYTAFEVIRYEVDTASSASLVINPITDDNIIDSLEATQTILVSGNAAGDASVGDIVRFTINGKVYEAIVEENGDFGVAVAGADLAAEPNFMFNLIGEDEAGNPFTVTVPSLVEADLVASASITVDNITVDDAINAMEATQVITVTGSVGGDAQPGDVVTLFIHQQSFFGEVDSLNNFAVQVPGSVLSLTTSFIAQVSGADPLGNSFMVEAMSNYHVDLTTSTIIQVLNITEDDVLNFVESQQIISVVGFVSGDASEGDLVRMEINGTTYSGAVDSSNNFSIPVLGYDLASDTSFTVNVSGMDDVGNTFSVDIDSTHTADLESSASIVVDAVTMDGIINAAEVDDRLIISGRVMGDAAEGDLVSFTVNNTLYSGFVNSLNEFQISVLASELSTSNVLLVTVFGMDDADNLFQESASVAYSVDLTASASISVDSITSDNILNELEVQGDIFVSGAVAGDAGPGDTVAFDLNGNAYSSIVDSQNRYQVNVSGSDLAAQANFTLIVTGADEAGNEFIAEVESTYTVDTTTATRVFVSNISVDDVINAAETSESIAVVGFVTGDAEAGDAVYFTLNGNDYSGVVDANNNFDISVSGADLVAQTSFELTVEGFDSAGNAFSETTVSTHSVDLIAEATLMLNPIAEDNVINALEATQGIMIRGRVGGEASRGDQLSVNLNGVEYNAVVGGGGLFNFILPGAELVSLNEFELVLQGQDDAGNTFNLSEIFNFSVDLESHAAIFVNSISDDDVINAVEAALNVQVDGRVEGDASEGDLVTFFINGVNYSGRVDSLGFFTINVAGADLATGDSFVARVEGADDAGNVFSVQTVTSYSVDLEAFASITMDPITADNIININETLQQITLTGAVAGDAELGDLVEIDLGGLRFSGMVQAGNRFSVDIDGSDLAAANELLVSVSGSDEAGNAFTAQTNWPYIVDTTTSTSIFVSNITSDDIINSAEATQVISVNGFVTGDATQGDVVTFQLNDRAYAGEVDTSNNFSIPVDGADLVAQTSFIVHVTGMDDAGNSFDENHMSTHLVDLDASASLALNLIADDGIVNLEESTGTVWVSGTVSGDAAQGDSVSFTVNGNLYQGVVNDQQTFAIAVDGADLSADTEYIVLLEGEDDPGNVFRVEANATHDVDLVTSASIFVNNITSDDVINLVESQQNILVSGSVGGDASTGDLVFFDLNNQRYSGLVNDKLNFTITVAGNDLANDSSFNLIVTGHDSAGNQFNAEINSQHTVDTLTSASIDVDPITSDDTLNLAESQGIVSVTGSVGGDATAGDLVRFTINGQEYSGAVDISNTFSIDVAGSDLVTQTSFFARVSGTDNVGNTFNELANSTYVVDTEASAELSVGNVTADNVLNSQEAQALVELNGTVSGDAREGDRIFLLANNNLYETFVDGSNSFLLSVPGSDIGAQTSLDVNLTGEDDVGNTFHEIVTLDYIVDTVLPTIASNQLLMYSQNTNASIPLGSVSAADNQRVTRFEFTNGQGENNQISEDGYYQINNQGEISLTVAGATPGVESNDSNVGDNIYQYGVLAFDSALNPSIAQIVELRLRLVFVKISNIDVTTDNTPVFYGLYSDIFGDITLQVDGASYIVEKDGLGGWSFTLPTALQSGSYIASVSAANTASDMDAFDVVQGMELGETLPGLRDEGIGSYIVNAGAATYDISAQNLSNTALEYSVMDGVYSNSDTSRSFYTAAGRDYVFAGNLLDYIYLGNSRAADGETYDDGILLETAEQLALHAVLQVDSSLSQDHISDSENTAVGDVAFAGLGNDIVYGEEGTDIILGGEGADILRGGYGRDALRGGVGDDHLYGGPSPDVLRGDLGRDTFYWEAGDEAQPDRVDTSKSDIILDFSPLEDVLDLESFLQGESSNASSLVNYLLFAIEGENTIVYADLDGDGSGTDWTIRLENINLSGSEYANSTNSQDIIDYLLSVGAINTSDSSINAGIFVNPITDDDVLNLLESTQTILVSGYVEGDLEPGDIVSFSVNGSNYQVLVDVNREYSVAVNGSDLLAQTSFLLTAQGSDDSGLPFTANTTSIHIVDIEAEADLIVESVAGDSIVNAFEAKSNIFIDGHVSGDASAGDEIVVQVNGNEYAGLVDEDLRFIISVPGVDLVADTTIDYSMVGQDSAGNTFSASTNSTHTVDTESSASLVVNNITADDILSPAEIAGIIAISGSASGDAEEGDSLNLTINNTQYSGELDEEGLFSISVSGSDLAVDTSFIIALSGEDEAGNPFIVEVESSHLVDMTPPTITVGQVIEYQENRPIDEDLGVLIANDNLEIESFQFSNGTQVSDDGYYLVDDNGVIRLSTAGAAEGVENNEFESGNNTFTYEIVAVDVVGNVSAPTSITLAVIDDGYAPDDGHGEYIISGSNLAVTAYDPGSPSVVQYTETRDYNGEVTINTLEEFNVNFSNGIDINSTYYLTNIDSGNFANWVNVHVPVSGNYYVASSVASTSDGGIMAFSLDNWSINLGSIMVPNTGGHENWREVELEAYIEAGTHSFTMSAPSGGWNADFIFFYPVAYQIHTGAGRDLVEGGDGDEEIHLGDTAAIYDENMPQLSALELANLAFISDDVNALYDGNGHLRDHIRAELSGFSDIANAAGNDDIVLGENGTDAIFGGEGRDELHGGAGRDVLRGGNGDDFIIGGPHADVLMGDSGADTFRWERNDHLNNDLIDVTNTDIVIDFNRGENDSLDLSGLLEGETSNADHLVNFLQFSDDGEFGTYMEIDVDGDGSGVDWLIHLKNHNLNAGSQSDQAIIQNLLGDNSLFVDN